MAPPVHPSVNLRYDPAAPTAPLYFRVAADAENLYIRLRWPDDSTDAQISAGRFADAAAVQFALVGRTETSFMMGTPQAPVNIWYWNAGEAQAQNLAAGGFGHHHRGERLAGPGGCRSHGRRGIGWWVVSRALTTSGEHQVAVAGGDDVHLTFAVWQGDEAQRDGLKRTSTDWITVTSAEGDT